MIKFTLACPPQILPLIRRWAHHQASSWAIPAILIGLTSCVPVKKHAPMTQIEGRRSLEQDFRPKTQVAPRTNTSFLDFDELVSLARQPQPDRALAKKLERFWKSPVISNHAWQSGKIPHRPYNSHMGEFLRVGTWNVEKSLHLQGVATTLKSESAYRALMNPRLSKSSRRDMLRQRERLVSADILIFQEMDIGVDRSHYVHSAKLLGKQLGMNYAYAPQQLELTPVLQAMATNDPETAIDTTRYRGVFGLAVLSKYPIKSAVCFQLNHQPYDWYHDKEANYDAAEHARRFGSEAIFDTEIMREVKVGGRIFFRVDLEVPGLPHDTLSIIPVHLEIRAQPEDRHRQLEEILSHIKDIPHPVILAGDFNSSRYDLSPTSIERVIKRGSRNPRFWMFALSNLLIPAEAIYNTLRGTFNEMKNLYNPLAFHESIFLPNETANMFEYLEQYRFADGTKFDFRGDPDLSINGSDATLANSNEKMLKGYRTTFQVNRPIWPYGRHRLDWIFVKSSFYDDTSNSFKLAPHFGETIVAFDQGLTTPLSDHRPCVVDLPIGEITTDPNDANVSH